MTPHHANVAVEEGDGNWLMSYADMMTLLVGFFVMLLSFAVVDQAQLEAVKESLAKEFGGEYEVPFTEIVERLSEKLNGLGMGEQFEISQTRQGVEISFVGTAFFETGSVDIKDQAQVMLAQVIPIIKSEKANFKVIVEGHTDDVPVSGGQLFRSNWELSSLRACRVLDSFIAGGFQSQDMTAVGYGETRPVAPNRDAAGAAIPTNQARNRRVVLKLIKGTSEL